jgi:hypothetical protein
MTGGGRACHQKRSVKRSKLHGEIIIRMIDGRVIDPPIRLPGDSSCSMECDFCHQIFAAHEDTPVVLLSDDYKFRPGEVKRTYRMFCCVEDTSRSIVEKTFKF